MREYCVDIETDGLLDTVTKVHCMWITDLSTGEERCYHDGPFSPRHGSILDGVTVLENADRIWGHNLMGFDILAIQKVLNRLWIPYEEYGHKVRDTLLMAQICWPDIAYRKDLPWPNKREKYKSGKVGPIMGYSLEAFGKRLGEYKGDPGAGWEACTQQMVDYCRQDTRVNVELIKCLKDPAYFLGMEPYGDVLYNQETTFALLMKIQQQHGWPFDIAAASQLQAELQARKDELHAKLAPLVEPEVIYMKTPLYYMHPEYPAKKWPTKGDCQKYLREHKTERTLKERYEETVAGPVERREIPWNPGSRDQVKKLLYDRYNWKPTKWADKKGNVKDHVHPKEWPDLLAKDWHEVVDDDVLRGLGVPELEPLADYFAVSKILSMLATGDKAHMRYCGADNRIHGEVNSAKVLGGRCGHSNPNTAQIPACHPKKPYNARFRALYHCLPGHKQVGCDASALELRVMAHWGYTYDNGDLSNLVDDPEKDIHWELCKRYGIAQVAIDAPRDESNHEWEGWRSDGKPLTYGIPYGAQAAKVARMLGCSIREAEDLLDYMRVALPGMIVLRDEITKWVEKRGETKEVRYRDGSVRKRYVAHTGWVKGIDGRYNVIRSAHASLNTKLQGDGGIFMKRLLIEVIDGIRSRAIRVFGIDCPWTDTNMAHYDVALLGSVHDEYQLSVREEHVKAVEEAIQEAFDKATKYYQLRCPIRGESKVGNNWAETH